MEFMYKMYKRRYFVGNGDEYLYVYRYMLMFKNYDRSTG